ncbi:MAG: hypothetical protein AAF388_29570, partial [Bacteroidota bacterium]
MSKQTLEILRILEKLVQKINYGPPDPSVPSRYVNMFMPDNGFYYIVSIPEKKIIFQRGLEKMGYSLPKGKVFRDGSCELDPSFAYQFAIKKDKDDLIFLSEYVLNPDNIRHFTGSTLSVDFRGITADRIEVRIIRECKIIHNDPISGLPSHYLTWGFINQNLADLTSGLRFSLHGPEFDEANKHFRQHMTDAYKSWKYAQFPLNEKEVEIFSLYHKGYMKAHEIAPLVGLNVQTVRTYIRDIKEKLRSLDASVRNNMDVIRFLKDESFIL